MQAIRQPQGEERAAISAEVERFLGRVVAPQVARHEAPLEPAQLAGIMAAAEALGLGGSAHAPTGLAPWEELHVGAAPADTVELLARVSRTSTAVGLALHQRALARVVLRRAGLPLVDAPVALALEGSLGLGRTALARLLHAEPRAARGPIDADDRAILADVYAPNAARVLPTDPGAVALVTPVFASGALGLQLHQGDALITETEHHAHGLDELRTVRAWGAGEGTRVVCPPDLFAESLAAQMLAYVALALGAVERALDIARRFAAERRQGGAPIDRHAAVLALLGQAQRAVDGVRAELSVLSGVKTERRALGRIAAFRADAHPRLADGAHAALQVAGGLGYMRETGLEKVARDVNVLRVIGGAPPELALFAAEWRRLDGC